MTNQRDEKYCEAHRYMERGIACTYCSWGADVAKLQATIDELKERASERVAMIAQMQERDATIYELERLLYNATRLLGEVHALHPQPDICSACRVLGRAGRAAMDGTK